MAWPTRFVAVPTGQLKQDDQIAPSSKATHEQLRAYMAQLPVVYDKLGAGAGAEAFRQMRTSADPQTRAVGDAYHHLFSPAGVDHRLEAEYVDGKGLVVTRGRHRVEAAREIGLPYVPVHVRAADDRTLDAATRNFEGQLQPAAPDVVHAQRQLDGEHRDARMATVVRTGALRTVGARPNDRTSQVIDATGARSPSRPSRDRADPRRGDR
ncbi:hypothetical protein NOCA2480064 [metagenome]|uniref:ParB/Sulfiredoxin domain-containing protein n=1 Tax=metagenome TaxID=256318 RepID=A0A2P2C7S0_9ZZZZ